MTKADLVEQVAEAIGPGITKKDCALVVDGFLNAVKLALSQGENIEIRGFGTFKVRASVALPSSPLFTEKGLRGRLLHPSGSNRESGPTARGSLFFRLTNAHSSASRVQ